MDFGKLFSNAMSGWDPTGMSHSSNRMNQNANYMDSVFHNPANGVARGFASGFNSTVDLPLSPETNLSVQDALVELVKPIQHTSGYYIQYSMNGCYVKSINLLIELLEYHGYLWHYNDETAILTIQTP